MTSIEEFFKNRISFTMQDNTGDYIFNRDFRVKEAFYYKDKIYNPLSLNITNTIVLLCVEYLRKI